jgi:prevent-host-death family protein
MPLIGIRELSRRVSGLVTEVERTRRPLVVTRHGRPVVAIVPVDAESVEEYVLANVPEFVESMTIADRELAAGETRSLDDVEVTPAAGSARRVRARVD